MPALERPASATPILAFDRIRAGYSGKDVLSCLTLGVVARERVVILGANGAGKSTLFRVAVGLLQPREGIVRYEGADITALLPNKRARAGIAFVMQGGRVFSSLSVRENLWLAVSQGAAADASSAIDTTVQAFPMLKERWSAKAALLSGGERQIVAIAMGLVREPKVLLLDEPSAGLAPGLAESVLQRVFAVSVEREFTLLVVEHRVAVLRLASRAVILSGGGLALETSYPSSWLTDGTLERVFLNRPVALCSH